jgi:hypothetical protein
MVCTKCFGCILFLSILYGCGTVRLPILLGETDRTIIWSVYSAGYGIPTNEEEMKQRSENIVTKVCKHGGSVKMAAIPLWHDLGREWSVIVECNKGKDIWYKK